MTAIVIGLIFSRTITRPMYELIGRAQRIGASRLGEPDDLFERGRKHCASVTILRQTLAAQ